MRLRARGETRTPPPPPGSAFATAGSAARAPTNLLLFIFPGSKVLTEQPELFSCLLAQGGGGFGARGVSLGVC